MTVENKTILQKMMNEMQLAKAEQSNELMKRHISNIKILCELMLEDASLVSEEVEVGNQNKLTNQEIRAMIGEQKLDSKLPQIEDNKGTEDSLFDF